MRKKIFNLKNSWQTAVILGHSNEGNLDGLTFDTEIRLRAGGKLFQSGKVKEFFLLGGGNDKVPAVPEAERMKNYLIENFKIPENIIRTESLGINTIENISNFIKAFRNKIEGCVFITSDYNLCRVKLILEIFGESEVFVLSAEKILLINDDETVEEIKNYLDSIEYQNRLFYENYWLTRTIYDDEYTKHARERLGIKQTPIQYFQSQKRRIMENLEEEN